MRAKQIQEWVDKNTFIRPGRITPRKTHEELEQLKYMEQFDFTENGFPLRRSEEDFMDETYAKGVQAGLDAAAKFMTTEQRKKLPRRKEWSAGEGSNDVSAPKPKRKPALGELEKSPTN